MEEGDDLSGGQLLLTPFLVLLELVDEQNHLHLMDGDVEEACLVGGDGLAKVVGDDGLGVLAGANDDVTKVDDSMLQGVSVISAPDIISGHESSSPRENLKKIEQNSVTGSQLVID